jgi:two-component system OmpR family sensor kinase
MGGLVEDLLELARLDETKPLALTPVDLLPLARDAALDAMASAPGRTITVVTKAPDTDEAPVAPPAPAIDLAHSTGEVPTSALVTVPERAVETAAVPHPTTVSFAGATLARLRTRRPRKADAVAALPQPVPAAAPTDTLPAVVMAEENKIRQVITNLMGNALRFSPADSPIELEISVDRRNQRASVAVIDHGEGIPPQIRDKIFQRFWRADTSRARETGGSGLGLAIVASIVASHNGTVQVVETPGGGATFRVWFPLAESPNAPQRLAITTAL